MSLSYVEQRIKEALKLAEGNQFKARQQVIAWTYEDTKLLYDLAKPHLSGIVAYNIERVASGRAEAAKEPVAAPPVKPAAKARSQQEEMPKKTKHGVEANPFGLDLLKAATGEHPTIFGLEDAGAPRKRQGVSQSHVDAIKALAAKGKRSGSGKKKPD